MPSFFTIAFAIRALIYSPALDAGIDPIMQPILADGSKLQIEPITRQDIEQINFHWGVRNETVIGHASIRLGVTKTAARFLNILGNVESGISDDLLILLKSTDRSIGLRVARVQKIRYKMVQADK
jgi:hypothetical protein